MTLHNIYHCVICKLNLNHLTIFRIKKKKRYKREPINNIFDFNQLIELIYFHLNSHLLKTEGAYYYYITILLLLSYSNT